MNHNIDPIKLVEKALGQAVKLCKENRTQEAEIVLNQLVKVQTDNLEAHLLLGIISHKNNQFIKAIEHYMRALAIDKDNPETNNNIALSYASLGQFEFALKHIRRAIELKPQNASYHDNRGLIARQSHNWNESLEGFSKAIELNPQDPHTWLNMGGLHGDCGNLDKAIECFKKSIALIPDFSPGHVDLAYAYQLQGKWSESWSHYEHRLVCFPQCKKVFEKYDAAKMWDGSPIKGKKLVLWCEQGIGDIFHFVRFVENIWNTHDPEEVILEVPESCKDLLKNNVAASVVSNWSGECDFHCSLMSLPHILGITELSKNPYIRSNKKANLGYNQSYKIGICWAGNPQHPYDASRSFNLSRLKPLQNFGTLFSLMKDIRKRVYANRPDPVDLTEGSEGMNVVNLQSKINTFEDTAAIIDEMDLIVTADTSVLHLAGAMGKEVFAMIPKHCDWRWEAKGETTFWYPKVRLFRSKEFGKWGNAFEQMTKAVEEKVTSVT